jgi:hypothetical protein
MAVSCHDCFSLLPINIVAIVKLGQTCVGQDFRTMKTERVVVLVTVRASPRCGTRLELALALACVTRLVQHHSRFTFRGCSISER